MKQTSSIPTFIYTYGYHEDEQSLCQLEMRSFFGIESSTNVLISSTEMEPSRSPFMKDRIEVIYKGDSLLSILEQVQHLDLLGATFKVVCLNNSILETTKKIKHEDRRRIEREIGLLIDGEADFEQPDHAFGVVKLGDQWYFGHYRKSEAVWFHHVIKPHSYSTALSTRVARAVANIAVPHPNGVRAIDPCCGIGTVLVEALSMGIDIEGRDINPLVTQGSRKNLAHFGLKGEVTLGPISDVSINYDVAIIDMPYNLFTHITAEEQFSILQHARRFANKVVVITIETIDQMIEEAGFKITDRGIAKKGSFSRQVIVCE